jgi:hypothetical protein
MQSPGSDSDRQFRSERRAVRRGIGLPKYRSIAPLKGVGLGGEVVPFRGYSRPDRDRTGDLFHAME